MRYYIHDIISNMEKSSLKWGKDVLLFYVKHKWDYTENYSKRSISGFMAWYKLLKQSLEENGYIVHENDYGLAKKNPNYPIGLIGTPVAIPGWDLPNPVILGPSMYDNPLINPDLMKDRRFRYYILTCDWLKKVFEKVYGNKCILWYAGISDKDWVDVKNYKKKYDILIYNKIRWGKEQTLPLFYEPIIKYLNNKNINYITLNYGDITHKEYKDALKKSRGMIFLCEHETQGIAYQEALMSNIPIIAWDHGWWTDPVWPAYSTKPIKASSVPLFSPMCGEKFEMIKDFPDTFDFFWKNLLNYKPRKFMQKEGSFKKSADTYTKFYFSLKNG